MKISDIKPTHSWKEAGELPTLGEGLFGLGWIAQALDQLSAAGDLPQRAFDVSGSFEGSALSLFGEIQALAPELKLLRREHPAVNGATDYVSALLYNDHGGISFDAEAGSVSARVVSNDFEFITKMFDFFQKRVSIIPPAGTVYMLIQNQHGGLELASMGTTAMTALQRDNYTPEALKEYDRMVADLKSKSPSGRIAIFEGEPGTGKTYLVRGLLSEVEAAIYIIIPSNLIAQLAQPGMIPVLVSVRRARGNVPMIFIVEDADECLSPRMNDNMSSITNILNFGDGLLGHLLDVRIVATTNAHRVNLDEAILRPGRLSALIHVGRLPAEQAQAVFARLTGGPSNQLTSTTTLAEVYSLARNSGWTPPTTKTAMGFANPKPAEPPTYVNWTQSLRSGD